MNQEEVLLRLAQLPQKEFERVAKNLDRIEKMMVRIRKLIHLCGEEGKVTLGVLVRLGTAIEMNEKEEAPEKMVSLCHSCASPCSDASEEILSCKPSDGRAGFYHQLTEKCPECRFFDHGHCTCSLSCTEAKHFQPKVPRGVQVPV